MPEYILPAHAHRHERYLKYFPDLTECSHCFPCLFLSSPEQSGLGFGTLIRHPAFFIVPDWLPGFH